MVERCFSVLLGFTPELIAQRADLALKGIDLIVPAKGHA
jgi:hypothetical protein